MVLMRKPIRQRRGSGANGIPTRAVGGTLASSAACAAGLFLLANDACITALS